MKEILNRGRSAFFSVKAGMTVFPSYYSGAQKEWKIASLPSGFVSLVLYPGLSMHHLFLLWRPGTVADCSISPPDSFRPTSYLVGGDTRNGHR